MEIDANGDNTYNGAVEASLTLLGITGALSAGYVNGKQIDRWNLWILTVCSAFEGCFLLWAATTKNIFCCYMAYVMFGTCYYFMNTVAR